MWQIIEGLKPEKNLALIPSLLGAHYIMKWYFKKISLSVLCRKEKPWPGDWPEYYWKNPHEMEWRQNRSSF